MNPKQLLVPGAVLVGGYFLLKPGGILEQLMGSMGGSAEGGAPMADPYGGGYPRYTDETVTRTDSVPDQGTAPTEPTVVNNYYYDPGGGQGGNPNKASATGQASQNYSIWPAVENVGTAALAAGSALWAAKQIPRGTGTKIGQTAKDYGKRAWDIGKRYAPRAAVVGAVAGATALAVGGDSTDWLGLGRLVPWIEGGLGRLGIQPAAAASNAPVDGVSPASVGLAPPSKELFTLQPATINYNPFGGSAPAPASNPNRPSYQGTFGDRSDPFRNWSAGINQYVVNYKGQITHQVGTSTPGILESRTVTSIPEGAKVIKLPAPKGAS